MSINGHNAVAGADSDLSASLAADLAAGIYSQQEIFDHHGIDVVQASVLLKSDWFQKMVEDARKEWASIDNAKERIRVKARLSLEEGIIEMFNIIRDKNVPAAARVGAFKELKEIGGVVERQDPNQGAAGMIPSVQIFLGNQDGSASVNITHDQKSHGVTAEVEDAEVIDSFSVDTSGFMRDAETADEEDDGVVMGFGDL